MLGKTFAGDLHSPKVRVLQRPEFNQATAAELASWGLSAGLTLDQVYDAIYEHHTGRLFDYDGAEVNREREDIMQVFGGDPERQMLAYLRFAKTPLRQRLQRRLVRRVMFLHVAVTIRAKRLSDG